MLARSRILALGAVLAAGWGVVELRIVRVTDGEMAPSLREGDWLLLGPGEPSPGDVVRVEDPAEPGRRVLRRVVAVQGHPVRFRGGRLVTGRGVPIKEMGRSEGLTVLAEANRWLIGHRAPLPRYDAEELVVGPGELYVLSDARDLGVDSRWWGTLPVEAVKRELWLRIGLGDAWREAVLLGSEDGPWAKPKPEAPTR